MDVVLILFAGFRISFFGLFSSSWTVLSVGVCVSCVGALVFLFMFMFAVSEFLRSFSWRVIVVFL